MVHYRARLLCVCSVAAALTIFLSAWQLIVSKPVELSVVGPAPPPSVSARNASPVAATTPAREPVLVRTTTAKRGTLRATIDLSGVVVPGQVAQLSFSSAGTVRAVHVQPGQRVQ